MDIIVFKEGGQTLYRPPSEHSWTRKDPDVAMISHDFDGVAYERRATTIDSLCGSFTCMFSKQGYERVIQPCNAFFGSQGEMYHSEGTLQVYGTRVQFKGALGMQGIRNIASDLSLANADCKVHMAIFRQCIGKFLQTSHSSYLENRVEHHIPGVTVLGRTVDMNVIIQLVIKDVSKMPQFKFSGEAVPSSVDIRISNKGSVVMRMSFPRSDWDEAAEAETLTFCNWLGDRLTECC